MKQLQCLAAAAAIIAVCTSTAAMAQDAGRDATVWTWSGNVDRGRWFRLSSVNGPVTVEPSHDGRIHVRAEKVVRRGNVKEVRFRVIEIGGDVRVCAMWRDSDVCDEDGLRSEKRDSDRAESPDITVRFTVGIPPGVRLGAGTVNGTMLVRGATSDVRASSVNGAVEVRDAGGEVNASTVNGSVDVTTRSGPVSANTVNGSIKVRMASAGSGREMKFNTVNGNITVETPASLNANVSLDTMHGSLFSDFPLQISGRFGPRHAEGRIGAGGPALRMRTLNGSVELRKSHVVAR